MSEPVRGPSAARRLVGPCLAMLLAAARPCGGAEVEVRVPTESVWLQSNLRELYPHHEEIYLERYEQLADGSGVVLWLRPGIPAFARYLVSLQRDSLPREAPRANTDGAIVVRFDASRPEPQRIVVAVQAVARSGATTRAYRVELAYVPRGYYAASGNDSRSWIVVRASDLSPDAGDYRDWIVDRPTPAERDTVRRRWGWRVERVRGDLARAQVLAAALLRVLRPHEGVPTASMARALPLDQLARAESGRDRVWCGNESDIFSFVGNALGVPVRRIGMQRTLSSTGATSLEIAEGHRTTEVFDRQLNRWVWVDLPMGILGAYLVRGEPIDMARLVRVLDDDLRRPRLRLLEWDAATGAIRDVPYATSTHRRDLARFFRPEQRFRYVRVTDAGETRASDRDGLALVR